MKNLKNIHDVIRDNLKNNRTMRDCNHKETGRKVFDNRLTSITRTIVKGVNQYEKS